LGAWERLSAKPKHVRSLILNGGAAARAELQWLRDRRPEQDVIADSSSGAPSVDLTDAVGGYRDPLTPQIIGEKCSRIYFLDPRNVEYLASAGNYVTTHMAGEQFLTRATLKSMSDMLLPLGFIQIARTLLVNLRQVAHVERCDRGQYCFVTRFGERLISARERSASLRELLLGATTPHSR